eukprot:COSAG01_NODE_4393_length_5071_cov_5.815768_3_plen_92_part_00
MRIGSRWVQTPRHGDPTNPPCNSAHRVLERHLDLVVLAPAHAMRNQASWIKVGSGVPLCSRVEHPTPKTRTYGFTRKRAGGGVGERLRLQP